MIPLVPALLLEILMIFVTQVANAQLDLCVVRITLVQRYLQMANRAPFIDLVSQAFVAQIYVQLLQSRARPSPIVPLITPALVASVLSISQQWNIVIMTQIATRILVSETLVLILLASPATQPMVLTFANILMNLALVVSALGLGEQIGPALSTFTALWRTTFAISLLKPANLA